MALALSVTFTGVVGSGIVRVLVNGTEVAIAGDRTYTATVDATVGTVGITTIGADGAESVRTLLLTATSGAPG